MDTIIRKSEFIQSVRREGSAIVWHSLFGRPKLVTDGILEILDTFSVPMSIVEFSRIYEVNEADIAVIQQLLNDGYLIPLGFDERAQLSEAKHKALDAIESGLKVEFLELIVTESCNFRCTYCIHFNNLEMSERHSEGKKKMMQFEIAKKAVDEFFSLLKRNSKKDAVINFGGGEPLLGWPLIERVVKYCLVSYGESFSIKFTINTNASLITEDIAKKLKKYEISVASSLDGLKNGNDKVRISNRGGGTFSVIVAGFEKLADVGYPLDGFSVTVDEKNFPDLDETIIDWAVSRGMKEVRVDIDVITALDLKISDVVVKLLAFRKYAQERGVEVFGYWSRPVENLNESPLESHVAFCGAVRGNSICVNPSGIVYSCGYSSVSLGTISDIPTLLSPDSKYQKLLERRLPGNLEMCRGCMIEGQCGGGCEITQEFSRIDGAIKVERMCSFYKEMTKELLLEQLQETS